MAAARVETNVTLHGSSPWHLGKRDGSGPISDRRLVSRENDIVTFMARSTDKTKSKQQVPVRLSGVEFTRRWSLHILPKGFTRTRCYGGYSSRYRKRFIALCHQLRPQTNADERRRTANDFPRNRRRTGSKDAPRSRMHP